MLWIKICGTTNLVDACAALDAGANALGFILTASPRQIALQLAAEIIRELPPSTEKIGVVANEPSETLRHLAETLGLTGFQLHGNEPPDQISEFRRTLGLRKIIKTLHMRELLAEPAKLDAYLANAASIDGFLLDSGSASTLGGTGNAFDWKSALPLVDRIKQNKPVIVAGGLNPDNVGAAIRLFEPCGVDVVSGVEISPGTKDPARLRAFIAAARAAANSISYSRNSSRGVPS